MDREQSVKSILITSSSIPEKALEAGKSLVSAFFPLAAIKVITDSSITGIEEQISGCLAQNGSRMKAKSGSRKESFGVIEVEKDRIPVEKPGSGDLINRLQVRWLQRESGLGGQEEERQFGLGGQETERQLGGQEEETRSGLAGQDIRKVIELSEEDIQVILKQPFPGKEPIFHVIIKHGLLKLLTAVTKKELPWGILTGIRPAKLMHTMADQGITERVQESVLEKLYALRQDKIKLLQEIASVQANYLKEIQAHPEWVSLYIGIPFCPSRCSYCSFPGYALGKERTELTLYWHSLRQEIRAAGEMMSANGLWGDSLYIGGGTPSILTEAELRELLEACRSWLPLRPGLELTVEAGRPDTLSEKKLETLASCGVNRLSINPQTMQEKTLRRIGRAHSVESVVEMYKAARRVGEWMINMDLILGLPGEGTEDVSSTLEQLEGLQPDNLTVHALALKRGSKQIESGYGSMDQSQTGEMQRLAEEKARSWGLRPYYLYRQKRIAGNLENIGYARPGAESRYNIAIMEERQSIIGLGAGAATKIVNPLNYTLKNLPHASAWQTYMGNWAEVHAERMLEFSRK